MAEMQKFSAPIESASGGGAYVTVPFDVEQVFGAKRVPVQATIDGVAYRGSLVRMGGSCHVLGVLKEIRARIGKEPGDVVEVTLEKDDAPRVAEVPPDLAEAFASAPDAKSAFRGLAYSHQREYVEWILGSKRDSTRAKRVARTVELLEAGEKSVRSARSER